MNIQMSMTLSANYTVRWEREVFLNIGPVFLISPPDSFEYDGIDVRVTRIEHPNELGSDSKSTSDKVAQEINLHVHFQLAWRVAQTTTYRSENWLIDSAEKVAITSLPAIIYNCMRL